ncbi:MAG: hypothetical protein EBX35_13760, partial [Planctomycetia bacterium]|nr:hypothetical protein [Planctomycetia bacterium]
MVRVSLTRVALVVGFQAWCLLVQAADSTGEPRPLDFNRDIRPILAENCFYCHGQDGQKREADLRLD